MFGYYFDLAIRSLRRNPVLTALMVLAIAVGIGASMTTLTVMSMLSGDPIPSRSGVLYYPQVDADPTHDDSKEPTDVMDYISAVDLWRAHRADRQTLLVDSAMKALSPQSNARPTMVSTLSTTADFFPMFAVPLRYGRAWSAEDDEARARVAVISSELNEKLFGGVDSTGRTLRVRDVDFRIVGVLDRWRPKPQFYTVRGGRYASGKTGDYYQRPQDVFMPFFTGLDVGRGTFGVFNCWHVPDDPSKLESADCNWVTLWAELDTPAKAHDYARFLADYAAQQKSLGRFNHAGNTRMRSLMGWLDFNSVVPGDVSLQVWLAFAFLAICLFNTIGLLLAKFMRRSNEIGVRRALGATRGGIFSQCLMEAGVIGLVGGAFGLVLALLGLWLVRKQPTAYADLAHLDVSMFLVTFALSVAAALLAGLLPAYRASRVAPGLQLKAL
jgi:putative ABC transport system permease protein